ncbi:MAG: DinB family protein [Bacteriovoracaceae bacterium]|nr:DinB family protein [Bacteroidota bacterium]
MTETPQQYISRILGNLHGENPMVVLKSTPPKIKKIIAGVKKKILYTPSAPGKWSVVEIVAHLAETEIVLGWRYRSIVEKNGVTLQPFEQDDWAKNSHYAECDINEMLDLYTAVRKANVNFLNGLSRAQWKRYGMHQERGKETIAHLVNLEAGHDINHFKQIQNILAK